MKAYSKNIRRNAQMTTLVLALAFLASTSGMTDNSGVKQSRVASEVTSSTPDGIHHWPAVNVAQNDSQLDLSSNAIHHWPAVSYSANRI